MEDKALVEGPSIAESNMNVELQEGDEGGYFNREILEHLCQVSPAEYLAKFRYVCKEWNEAALKSWREEAQLVLVDYRKKPRKQKFEKYLNLPDLIQRMENPDDPLKLDPVKEYHYQKYKLVYWYLTNKNPNMVQFWGKLGPSITRLEMCNLRVDRIDTVLRVLYEQVPNLRTLILEKIFVKIRDEIGENEKKDDETSILPQKNLKVLRVRSLNDFPVNWVVFLSHFPNIQVLESFNVKSDDDLTMILTAIQQIRLASSQEVLALKCLEIYRADDKKHCVQRDLSSNLRTILRECDFPLEELHAKLGCRTLRSVAAEFLKIFTGGLKKLTFHVDYRCQLAMVFPYLIKFPDLEELDLLQWCKPEAHLWALLKSMRNLKVLKVHGARSNPFCLRDDYYENAIAKKDKLNVCKSLVDFSFSNFKLNCVKFEYLAMLAPNLTKLELKMDDQIFRAACKKFQNLTELRVHGEGLTDDGLTGMPVIRGEKRRAANITALKKLRVFVLHDFHHLLTDISVFNGFLQLESLFTLQLAFPVDRISQKGRDALTEGIPNLIEVSEPTKKHGNFKSDIEEEEADDEDWNN